MLLLAFAIQQASDRPLVIVANANDLSVCQGRRFGRNMENIMHKRGDSLDFTATIPKQFPNGYFADWTVTSEVKKPDGTLVANLDIVWADPLKTRILHIQKFDTKPWPIGRLLMDVQFVRQDGYTISSNTITLLIEKDVTGGE